MTGRVLVVGLGPGGPDLLTEGTRAAVARIPHRYLRTSRHPAAVAVPDAVTFDALYERSETFEAVYAGIVEALVDAAAEHGEVLYAVPGSPAVAERTVVLLRQDPRVVVEVLPALSFVDLAWARLGVDPMAASVRIVDGRSFAIDGAGERGPLLVAQVDDRLVLSDVKLAVDEPPSTPVVVLHHLGLPDERIVEVAWEDLDRVVEPDHLTSLYVPELAVPVAAELSRFAAMVDTLRTHCPWDAEQDHRSLRPYLVEEAHEVLEAVDLLDDDPDEGSTALEEELGDLLYQVFFHAAIAAEDGRFTIADVARGIHDKLERRHPHVFGEVEVGGSGDVVANWEAIKRAEKGRTSVLDGIPAGLPALALAQKTLKRARGVGVEVPAGAGSPPPVDETGVGAALLGLVAAAQQAGVDAEQALRGAVRALAAAVRARELPQHQQHE
ncbi:MAG: MazG family protein [Acidimicrobiales bacterium]|nr:MazG family protein [Acidimicrobiales bacterium]